MASLHATLVACMLTVFTVAPLPANTAGDGPWTNLGFALPGVAGAPSLRGAGGTTPLAGYALTVRSAAPDAPGFLFVGFGVGNSPFLGGFMVPEFIAAAPVLTDSAGKVSLPGRWPAELVSVIVYLQVWIVDAAGPEGASATNGLAASAP